MRNSGAFELYGETLAQVEDEAMTLIRAFVGDGVEFYLSTDTSPTAQLAGGHIVGWKTYVTWSTDPHIRRFDA